jgi:hypothetical protein
MPRAYASQVARADLAPLLAELRSELHYAYLEMASDCLWSRYATDLPVEEALRGRVFGAGCEVQFQRTGEAMRITLLTEIPRHTTLVGATVDLANAETEEVTYLLWGTFAATSNAWIEPGFQRRWRYPMDGQPRHVGVRAVEYRDRNSGDLQFVRYVDLVPVEDGE